MYACAVEPTRHVVTVHRKKISKISDIATITTFSGNPGIIPSDDPGPVLSLSSKDIHLSKMQRYPGSMHPVTSAQTSQTDGQTDWHHGIQSAVYITSRTKKW